MYRMEHSSVSRATSSAAAVQPRPVFVDDLREMARNGCASYPERAVSQSHRRKIVTTIMSRKVRRYKPVV